MKCIKYPDGTIKRVHDFEAERAVRQGLVEFASRQSYREQEDSRIMKAVKIVRQNTGVVTFAKGTLVVGQKMRFEVEGILKKSHIKGGLRVIEEVEMTGVSVKPKLKAKERRAKDKKAKK